MLLKNKRERITHVTLFKRATSANDKSKSLSSLKREIRSFKKSERAIPFLSKNEQFAQKPKIKFPTMEGREYFGGLTSNYIMVYGLYASNMV